MSHDGELQAFVTLKRQNGQNMRVQANLLNRAFAWVGPLDTWGGVPHCVKLFRALIQTIRTKERLTGVTL